MSTPSSDGRSVTKETTQLSYYDIVELEAAWRHASTLGLELNTHLSFAPYCDTAAVPSPTHIAATFKRLLAYLNVWSARHTGVRFTYIRVAHSADDGTGRNPNLHDRSTACRPRFMFGSEMPRRRISKTL
jgi:hypothetical protein